MFMRDKAKFNGGVVLSYAKIRGSLDMGGSIFGPVNADSLQVDHNLHIDDRAIFNGAVDLVAAKIGGQLAMVDALFKQKVNGSDLQVGQNLIIRGSKLRMDSHLPTSKDPSTSAAQRWLVLTSREPRLLRL